jgi:hypothetical protein
MKKHVLFALLFVLVAAAISAQNLNNKGLLKYVGVSSDVMNYVSGNYVPNANHHWVETDESYGEVVLTFETINHSTAPTMVSLILNIPQVTDAQSNTGVLVYLGNVLIGKANQASAGSNLRISLETSQLKKSGQLTLTLKGGGTDGLAICSKASGFGAVLEFVY